ncbi:TPR-like protein [Mycena olivaceomarginata]|nr:TPR-like protein [Mycena olivaceomarginata]
MPLSDRPMLVPIRSAFKKVPGWVGLEQFFIASVDVGRLDVADSLKQLADRFPESPRVDVVAGIRLEVTESPDVLLQYYTQLLDADSANAVPQISVLRHTGKIVKAVEELSLEFLDTFYTDYLNQYNPRYILAFQALLHVLLVALQNPFYALQFAETAYTASDLSLALKTFPVVVDMCGRDLDSPEKGPVRGISVRAWLDVKLFRLTTSFCWGSRWLMVNSSLSASNSPVSQSLDLIEELATERLLGACSSKESKAVQGRDVAVGCTGARCLL